MANELESKIIKQIEYYFGDINLPRDKFLKEKIKEDDGWVTIETLLTFKRLASLSKDPEVIINAMKKAENGLVEVSEDSKKLRRSVDHPLPEFNDERKKELIKRTAYVKGFPTDETLDNIITFLEDHGNIDSCIKRTYKDKVTKTHGFKGSCFIVFKDEKDLKKFVESESIKYKDVELIRKPQEVYFEEKKKEIEKRKSEKKKSQIKAEPEQKIDYPSGSVLHLSGIEEGQIITREEIKEKLSEFSDEEPSFMYYNKGEKEGYVRMPKENSAVEMFKKIPDGILEIGEIKINVRLLEGEEEKKFLEKAVEDTKFRRGQRKNKKFGKRRNFNKNTRDQPQTKKQKTESSE